ncbi:hypothetical protein XFF6990_70009 [Xanthomonas citri pv. fuscans]|uniref:Uncharacterized protein n=1 Tax=Xanthomonas campestris pv. phaseoli TaxID=317013 RepID=A0A7Z7NJY0_XANCH|nr:hypothetical protein XFF6990_70009 [Xanthomonas citri pv. fuscans]SOO26797.1 hypothetical protein XFF6991_570362 [Xanthomonas phaseoli pv. phaseoli]
MRDLQPQAESETANRRGLTYSQVWGAALKTPTHPVYPRTAGIPAQPTHATQRKQARH